MARPRRPAGDRGQPLAGRWRISWPSNQRSRPRLGAPRPRPPVSRGTSRAGPRGTAGRPVAAAGNTMARRTSRETGMKAGPWPRSPPGRRLTTAFCLPFHVEHRSSRADAEEHARPWAAPAPADRHAGPTTRRFGDRRRTGHPTKDVLLPCAPASQEPCRTSPHRCPLRRCGDRRWGRPGGSPIGPSRPAIEAAHRDPHPPLSVRDPPGRASAPKQPQDAHPICSGRAGSGQPVGPPPPGQADGPLGVALPSAANCYPGGPHPVDQARSDERRRTGWPPGSVLLPPPPIGPAPAPGPRTHGRRPSPGQPGAAATHRSSAPPRCRPVSGAKPSSTTGIRAITGAAPESRRWWPTR